MWVFPWVLFSSLTFLFVPDVADDVLERRVLAREPDEPPVAEVAEAHVEVRVRRGVEDVDLGHLQPAQHVDGHGGVHLVEGVDGQASAARR